MASHFFFFSCSVLLVAAGLAETAERKGHVEADWEGYKAQFNKHYANAAEEARRKELYLAKVVEVNSHNADTSKSYKKGINHFSDMTRAEFRAHFTGAVPVNGTMRASEMYKVQARQNPPSDLDWRTKGAVTPVKDQGYCGSCWAFSTTGAIEGAYAVATGSLVSLSEQFIVSCDNQDYACNGGWPSSAMQYIQSYGGIPTETNYPYASSNGGQAPPCSNPQGAALSQVQVTGTTNNGGNELTLLNMVVNNGPVSICVDAADGCDWSSYESGIFDEPCYQATDHCVTMVGYSGYLVNQGYWIAKNQWGTNWGEQGYIRLVMAKNMCGLADYGVSPSVQTKTG